MDWREVYEPDAGGGQNEVERLRQRIRDLENQHEDDQREIKKQTQARRDADERSVQSNAASDRQLNDSKFLESQWVKSARMVEQLNDKIARYEEVLHQLRAANEALRKRMELLQGGPALSFEGAHHDSSGSKMML